MFIGFLKVEIKKTGIPKSAAVDILTDAVMAGLMLGRDGGYADAKGIYQNSVTGGLS